MITGAQLLKLAPNGKAVPVAVMTSVLNFRRDEFLIDTNIRLCHFLAQLCHESDGLRAMEEYASGRAYEGRRDLGNTQPGDGQRFKGRGPIQLTGRANYRLYGKLLGFNFEAYPEIVAKPEIGILVGMLYWKRKQLWRFADKDDVRTVTKRINGGFNGLADRIEYLHRAKTIWPYKVKVAA